MDKLKIITIEEHFLDPRIVGLTKKYFPQGILEAYGSKKGIGNDLPSEAIFEIGKLRIANMDKNGIDMQVISLGALGTNFLKDDESTNIILESNETLAQAISFYPTRFAGFAALPMAFPSIAAKELKRCVKVFGFKGAMINGFIDNKFIDDPAFDIVFKTAVDLDVPIYLHPNLINKSIVNFYYSGFNNIITSLFSTAAIGWHLDTGIQILRLILAGIFDKYPTLQIILGHWGELIPFFLERVDSALPPKVTGLKNKISYYFFNNIYITPSGMFNHSQLTNTMDMLGDDRIMYSVDYPFCDNAGAREFIENANISLQSKEKIAYRNAERLLKI